MNPKDGRRKNTLIKASFFIRVQGWPSSKAKVSVGSEGDKNFIELRGRSF